MISCERCNANLDEREGAYASAKIAKESILIEFTIDCWRCTYYRNMEVSLPLEDFMELLKQVDSETIKKQFLGNKPA